MRRLVAKMQPGNASHCSATAARFAALGTPLRRRSSGRAAFAAATPPSRVPPSWPTPPSAAAAAGPGVCPRAADRSRGGVKPRMASRIAGGKVGATGTSRCHSGPSPNGSFACGAHAREARLGYTATLKQTLSFACSVNNGFAGVLHNQWTARARPRFRERGREGGYTVWRSGMCADCNKSANMHHLKKK
jgi:hypothetical protein